MGNIAVDLQGVSVLFDFDQNNPTSLKEFFLNLFKGGLKKKYIHALDNISLQINQGEVFGVIGYNGAGKSTLLKIMSGIIYPTRGRVKVWGKITPILGIGAGFNPELTGRENVFMYSALLGRDKTETQRVFENIVDFSELKDFIDSPLRIYSTGMVARLGFTTAMAVQPEIILVDEVLAVGDERFQEKCKLRLEEFHQKGSTVIYVSHDKAEMKRLCERVAWLNSGRLVKIGETNQVISEYVSATINNS